MKIRNIETDEVLSFNDDWEIVEDCHEPLIQGDKYIKLFKEWCKVCGIDSDFRDIKFKYEAENDRLIAWFEYWNSHRRNYGISFDLYSVFEKLEDGEIYTYEQLVGKEK